VEKTETLWLAELATASSPPSGLNATDAGDDPAANGEPATGAGDPAWSTENTDQR
jgi:hypothetical protein